MVKILMLTPFLPYADARAGAPVAVYERLQLLASEHQLSVVTFATPEEKGQTRDLARLGVRVYALPRRTAQRGLALWRKRARLAFGLLIDSRPMLALEFGSNRMRRLLSRLLREQRFDLILVEHTLMAQYVAILDPKRLPPVALSEHDVHASLGTGTRAQSGALRPGAPIAVLLKHLDRQKWERYTLRAYSKAAVVLVPSTGDAGVVKSRAPGVPVEIVPFGAVPSVASETAASERRSDTLLFVGNFDHPPNRDAALWLCGEILPLIRERRPSVETWLVGKNPTPDIIALARDWVIVTGEVPSVEPYLRRCTLFVAPLREGGGMRIKLIEALAAGAPVVSTSLGAQGLGVESGHQLLLADDADDFAAAVLRALEDHELRAQLSLAGRELVSRLLNRDERLRKLDCVLKSAEGREVRKPAGRLP
jgi:glycosyltransferase involved in cell wall biosynthesis